MASSVKKICWTVLFVVTARIPPASWAHAHLTHQYPAADAEVTAAPQALTLNFSEGIEPGFSGAPLRARNKKSLNCARQSVTNRINHN